MAARCFCLSKTRPTPSGPASTPVSALRDELAGLKPSQIERRARSAGGEEAEMGLAKDSGDAKAAMIELIVAAAPVGGARQEARRAERTTLRPRIRLRAGNRPSPIAEGNPFAASHLGANHHIVTGLAMNNRS